MNDRQHFQHALRQVFYPKLRRQGFKGSGSTLRRVNGDVIQVLHVQGSIYGGRCCVNMGIHLTFLPTVGDTNLPVASTMAVVDCEFQRRMAPNGQVDYWWDYGISDEESRMSAMQLSEVYETVGAIHFDRFGEFPGNFAAITSKHLEENDFSVLPGQYHARTPLAMARIALHLGRVEPAIQFAMVGLSCVGSAVGLKLEYERLLKAM